MGSSRRLQQENLENLTDPFARSWLRLGYHIRKYVFMYVCGLMGVLALAIFPVIGGGTSPSAVSAGNGVAGAAQGVPSAAATVTGNAPGSAGGQPAVSAGSQAGGMASAAATGTGAGAGSSGGGVSPSAVATGPAGSGAGSTGRVVIGAGTMRNGTACNPGVAQVPWSGYALPCEAKFIGSNGGATYNGVTATTIHIAVRKTTDNTGAQEDATNAETEASGGVSDQQNWPYIQQIVSWMNNEFELYGRHVQLDLFNGQGNGTNESLDQGQAQACADADTVANSMHAFGEFAWSGIYETGVFGSCAAQYHVYEPESAAYYPEWWFQQRTPYVWGITMNCSLITAETAEWGGRQMDSYPAKWAGTDGAVSMKNNPRKFGIYVPGTAEYQSCVQAYVQTSESQYHMAKSRYDQYNYALDISTFPQDAQKAIIQFSANRDTSVVLACDPISPIFLTQDAVNQDYYPEWVLIGVAGTDQNGWAQLWDQNAIDGHLFGLSESASSQQVLSASSDAGRPLTKMGIPVNLSTVTDYYELLSMFNQLEGAGPDLTPANIGLATPKLPEGTGPFGTWYYGHTHSAIVDVRQVYWQGNVASSSQNGTYVEIYNGHRYQLGQFPTGEPPFYPGS